MEWKAIVRPFIWKFVPDGLIRWNDAAGLFSKQLIMVDQVETSGGSTMRAIARKRDPLARSIAHFQPIFETLPITLSTHKDPESAVLKMYTWKSERVLVSVKETGTERIKWSQNDWIGR